MITWIFCAWLNYSWSWQLDFTVRKKGDNSLENWKVPDRTHHRQSRACWIPVSPPEIAHLWVRAFKRTGIFLGNTHEYFPYLCWVISSEPFIFVDGNYFHRNRCNGGYVIIYKYFIHLASIYSVPREPALLQAPRTSSAQQDLWIKSSST